MKHDLESAEVTEAELLLPRVRAELRRQGDRSALFFLPVDSRAGRILVWNGRLAAFSSRAVGEHAIGMRPALRGLPLLWVEAGSAELNAMFRKHGAPEGALWCLNPCGACDWAESQPWELSLDPEALLELWAADSAARFAKIASALPGFVAPVPPSAPAERERLLERLNWLRIHIDSSFPELLKAISALEQGK